MGNYSLYSKSQLKTERSKGLDLSNEQNKNFFKPSKGGENVVKWTIEEFEKYLSTKNWDETIKHYHRVLFSGEIKFSDGGFDHVVNDFKSQDGYSFSMSHYDVKVKRFKYLHGQIFCKNFPAYTRVNPSILDEFMKKDDIVYVFKWANEGFYE